MKKKLLTALVLVICIQLALIGTVNAQPRPIGQTTQPNPFDSNPTTHDFQGDFMASMLPSAYDGRLATTASFYYGYAGYFHLSGFDNTPPEPFAISWVDLKVSYMAEGAWFSDDLYRILYYVDPHPDPIVLQDWVSGDAAIYDPGTNAQGHRAWAMVTEPNDGVWDWIDIGNVHVVIETDPGPNMFEDFVYMYVYEVWLTIYTGPLPPAGMSVQPPVIEDFGPQGNVFFIEIYLTDVVKFWGYQFVVYFDPAVMRCLQYFSYGPFNSPGPSGIGPDYVAVAYSSYFGDPVGLTGSGPVARIYLQLMTAAGTSVLDLEGVVGVDTDGNAVVVDVYDGMFSTGSLPEFPLGLSAVLMLAPMIPIVYIWRLRRKVIKQ